MDRDNIISLVVILLEYKQANNVRYKHFLNLKNLLNKSILKYQRNKKYTTNIEVKMDLIQDLPFSTVNNLNEFLN